MSDGTCGGITRCGEHLHARRRVLGGNQRTFSSRFFSSERQSDYNQPAISLQSTYLQQPILLERERAHGAELAQRGERGCISGEIVLVHTELSELRARDRGRLHLGEIRGAMKEHSGEPSGAQLTSPHLPE